MKKSLILLSLILLICLQSCSNSSELEITSIDKQTGKITTVKKGYKFNNKEAKKYNSIALEKEKVGKFDESLNDFLKANELEKGNPVILSNIGLIYQKQKKPIEAIEYYNKSITISDSTYIPALVNLSNLLIETNEFEKSIKLSKSILSKINDLSLKSGVYLNLVIASVRINDCKMARLYNSKLSSIIKKTKQFKMAMQSMNEFRKCEK